MHIFPNGKRYIGITKQSLNGRWQNGNGYKCCSYMDHAIRKYGWENVQHFVLFNGLSKEEAEQKEIELIAYYKSNNQKFGYNLESGGHCIGNINEKTRTKLQAHGRTRKHTPEELKKMSESQLGNKNHNFGKTASSETRKKMSNKQKGQCNPIYGTHRSNETKEKIRKKAVERKPGALTREKMSKSHTGGQNVNAKPILQFSKDGKFIRAWECIADAEKNLGLFHISDCCLNLRNTCGGFAWKFAKEGDCHSGKAEKDNLLLQTA